MKKNRRWESGAWKTVKDRDDMDGSAITFHPQQVFRFCPACGRDRFVFRENNSFGCEDCGFEFFVNAASAVAALVEDSAGKLLFATRAKDPMKGKLDLPGGFVDVGETAEQALKRELREELNLEVDDAVYFTSQPNTYVYGGITYFTLDLAFVCRVQGFAGMVAGDDVGGYRFLAPDEIDPDEIGLASIKEIVKCYLRQAPGKMKFRNSNCGSRI